MVEKCAVEGQGIGALRTLTYAVSSTIVERLEALDDAAHRLNYALLSDTPARCRPPLQLIVAKLPRK
jgi:hypothetical protein